MRFIRPVLLLSLLCFANFAHAMFTEVGLSYNYMKRTFDELDTVENQGTTLSLSFYIWEQVALEASYTDSLYVKKEKQTSLTDTTQRTTTQRSGVTEGDVIYVFADRKAQFQPYVKGGIAYITKDQVVQVGNNAPFSIHPAPAWAPSYGIGAKFMLTDSFAIKVSWDAVHTPIDDSTYADDVTGRAGISWIF